MFSRFLTADMASEDIAQLAETLSKVRVGDGELSYKGLGLKLDDAESGQTGFNSRFNQSSGGRYLR